FENWIHRDDLRVATGRATDAPPAPDLHEMADLSMRTIPVGLLVTGRSRPGKTARVGLTGAGRRDWSAARGRAALAPGPGPAVGGVRGVPVPAEVVGGGGLAGERLQPDELEHPADGDRALAGALLAAAPAFAPL